VHERQVFVDLDGSTHDDTSRFTIAAAADLIDEILAVVRHATTITGFADQESPC
jgi:hypothetical protein